MVRSTEAGNYFTNICKALKNLFFVGDLIMGICRRLVGMCHGGLRHGLWRLRILVELSCCKLKKIYVRYENFIYIGWAPVLGLLGLAGLSFMTISLARN